MPEKKVDGVKKMNKEEREKSRKIVLELIGESKKPDPSTEITPKSTKKIDGIVSVAKQKLAGRIKPKQEEENGNALKKLSQPVSHKEKQLFKKEMFSRVDDIVPVRSREKDLAPDFQNINPTEAKFKNKKELKTKEIFKPPLEKKPDRSSKKENQTLKQEKEKLFANEKAPVKQSSIINPFRNDNIIKELTKQKIRHKKERKQTEKLKRKQEKAKERAILARGAAREKLALEKKRSLEKQEKLKRKQEKAKEAKARKEKFGLAFKASLERIKFNWRKILLLLFASLAFGLLVYIIFFITVIKFSIDSPATRKIAGYFPLPVLIAKTGIVEYYDYLDLKNSLALQGIFEEDLDREVKIQIAIKMAFNDLVVKYRLMEDKKTLTREELYQAVSERVIYDSDINSVSIYRIKKIKQMIDKEGDFVRTAARYGDKLGKISITKDNEADLHYAPEVKNLPVDEVSDIIITPEGYYIFRCYGKNEDSVDLSFVFNKAKTLDEYLEELIKEYQFLSLVG
ncbi:hypothetical protein K8R32_03925 [bacterium]|nr:hypothetical protein [bacterium]